jgi:hypothetical protein
MSTSAPPDVTRVRALGPLLASIAREIEERSSALEALLVRRGANGMKGSSSA